MRGYGFSIGLASSLMGIAFGPLVTMALIIYGRPIHNSVATAAGLGVPITVAGTIGDVLAGLPHLALPRPLSLGFVSVISLALGHVRRLSTELAIDLCGHLRGLVAQALTSNVHVKVATR
jgi:uncharacterized membrane protein YfcA